MSANLLYVLKFWSNQSECLKTSIALSYTENIFLQDCAQGGFYLGKIFEPPAADGFNNIESSTSVVSRWSKEEVNHHFSSSLSFIFQRKTSFSPFLIIFSKKLERFGEIIFCKVPTDLAYHKRNEMAWMNLQYFKSAIKTHRKKLELCNRYANCATAYEYWKCKA